MKYITGGLFILKRTVTGRVVFSNWIFIKEEALHSVLGWMSLFGILQGCLIYFQLDSVWYWLDWVKAD